MFDSISRLARHRRVALGWTFLALLSLAAALGAAKGLLRGGQAIERRCVAHSGGTDDPVSVTRRFLLGAVERRDLGDAYNIVTPGFRGNESCSQWLAHPKPAQASAIDWDRTSYRLNPAGGEGQAIYDVFLYRPGVSGASHYLIELRTDEGNAWPGDGHSWRVAGWYVDARHVARPVLVA